MDEKIKLKRYLKKYFHQEFSDQIPGYVFILDLQSNVSALNLKAARLLGFNTSGEAIGMTYRDLDCMHKNDIKTLIAHDKHVIAQQHSLSFLCYQKCHSDWKLMRGVKSPLLDKDNNIFGIIAYVIDLSHDRLIDLSRFLMNTDGTFYQRRFIYLIANDKPHTYNHLKLSNRQMECLFFLVRGKSIKSIACLLNISPRTAEIYLEQIKKKLSCYSKQEIIEKAIKWGYMTFIPESLLA